MGFTGTFMYAVHLRDSKATGKLYFDLAQSYFFKKYNKLPITLL